MSGDRRSRARLAAGMAVLGASLVILGIVNDDAAVITIGTATAASAAVPVVLAERSDRTGRCRRRPRSESPGP